TGSGKTFTMAKMIEQAGRPALVLAQNKTLAAQLYHEFKGFFPENAVEYFVSYYDFYQPEAYVPSADLYIDKEATINDELDKLRMSATRSLFEWRDVVIVASVSCIYGLGSPEAYYGMLVMLEKGHKTTREALLRRFVDIQYERSEDLRRGTFRVRGDILEIYPTYEDQAYRIEMFGDQIDMLRQIDPLTGEVRAGQQDLSRVPIYPKTHYVMPQDQRERAIVTIHEEFEHRTNQIIYVSATPGPYELTKSGGIFVEQVIRPTGLVDPEVEIRPVKGQVDDLLEEIRIRAAKNERVLVTTLTKRMSEDLSEYFTEIGVRCRYLHSEIETLDRIKILRDLRRGE